MNDYTFASIIRKHATGRGGADRRALTFEGMSLTYRELDERSDRLAAGWNAAGFRKGDRVGVLMYNRLEWFEVLFGLAKLGGVIVPLNYMLKGPELRFILDDCDAAWLVVEDRFIDVVPQLRDDAANRRVVMVPDAYEELLAAGKGPVETEVRANDLLLLQYTSGTTGFPKGAMHTHATVLWNSYHQIPDFQVTADDVYCIIPALCWAAGLHDLALATLWAGGRVVLNPSTRFSPTVFCETVARERVTASLLVPAVLKRVLASGELARHDMSSLRMLMSGGEPVPVGAIEDLHRELPTCPLIQVYGMSEFPTLMLLLDVEEAMTRLGSAGKACSIAEIRIVGEHGEDAAPGEVGEILCRSPACLTGYYGREDASRETLRDGWLHTGDLARVDEEGYVFIVGRAKDMIISGGLNVYPAEVERIIVQHPAVAEAAVIGVPDGVWGEVGKAVVVLEEDAELDESDLRLMLKQELAGFKIPKHFELRHEPLPRTTSGKVQKFILRAELPPGEVATASQSKRERS
jgi:fatty-acyl-CoA synthase